MSLSCIFANVSKQAQTQQSALRRQRSHVRIVSGAPNQRPVKIAKSEPCAWLANSWQVLLIDRASYRGGLLDQEVDEQPGPPRQASSIGVDSIERHGRQWRGGADRAPA